MPASANHQVFNSPHLQINQIICASANQTFFLPQRVSTTASSFVTNLSRNSSEKSKDSPKDCPQTKSFSSYIPFRNRVTPSSRSRFPKYSGLRFLHSLCTSHRRCLKRGHLIFHWPSLLHRPRRKGQALYRRWLSQTL